MFPKFLFLFVSCIWLISPAFAQELEGPYDREYIGGVNFNTNAGLIGGGIFRYGQRVKKDRYRIFEVEIVNVKHNKETKASSSISGNDFIYKKENYLIPIRLRYGRQYLLFPAAQEEGVRVDFLWAGGATIGLVKAYMVQYDTTPAGVNSNSTVITEPYNPNGNDNNISGAAGFFSGLNHIKVVPGLNFKAGFVFQFVQFAGSVTGVEAGAMIEAYPQHIPIMAQTYNRNIYTSVYVNLFYGAHK